MSKGTVPITGTITTTSELDTYPTHWDKYAKGGFRAVADSVERNAITTERRTDGMQVFVRDIKQLQQLVGGVDNTKWITLLTIDAGNRIVVNNDLNLQKYIIEGAATALLPNAIPLGAKSDGYLLSTAGKISTTTSISPSGIALSSGKLLIGDVTNKAIESQTLKITNLPTGDLTGGGMLKYDSTSSLLKLATPDTDYATVTTLNTIAAAAQKSADSASSSATSATGSAISANAATVLSESYAKASGSSAAESLASAAVSSGFSSASGTYSKDSSDYANLSKAASAVAGTRRDEAAASASASANSASSASNSATSASTSLNKLLTTGLNALPNNGNVDFKNYKGINVANGTLPTDIATLAQVTAASSGALLSANNLSDVANASTARINLSLSTVNRSICIGNSTGGIANIALGNTGQVLQSNGTLVNPAYSTAAYPSVTAVNQILYSSSANVIAGLSTVNNSALLTNATGAPAFVTTTGTGAPVLATSPILVAPVLGTPASGTLTTCTGLPLNSGVTGNLSVNNLNTGTSASSTTFWRGDGTWAAAATGGGTVTGVTGVADRVTISGTSTAPVIDIASTYAGQTSITKLGTITTGVWNATVVSLANGGTGANGLTASNGGIFYSTASQGAILAGTATANQLLVSGASAAPAWKSRFIDYGNAGAANSGNIFMGTNTGSALMTGNSDNTGFGVNCMPSLLTGVTAGRNSAFGFESLNGMSSFGNVCNDNTAIGWRSGWTSASMTKCTFLGSGADVQTTGLTNSTSIGYNALETESNSITLGNTSVTKLKTTASVYLGSTIVLDKINGYVGIGTQTPTAQLHFSSTLGNRKIILFEAANNDHQYYGIGINPSIFRFQVDAITSLYSWNYATSSTTSAEVMRLTGTGRLGLGTNVPDQMLTVNSSTPSKISAGSWSAFSDERIKDVVGDYEQGLAEIIQIKTKKFKYNDKSGYPSHEKEKVHIGVIAQEIENIFPECIVEKIKKGDIEDMRVYDGSALTYALINAVKELNEKIETLKHIN